MDFRYKNFLFKVFERMPCSNTVYYFFQRYITKSLGFRDDGEFQKRYKQKVMRHLDAFTEFGVKRLDESTYYEFGAGWDLLSVLGFSMLGMGKLICVDINPLVHMNEVNNSLDFYKRNAISLNLNVPQMNDSISKKNLKQFLKRYFRIDYKAPYDAKETTLLSESIDYISSNVTLEHIPKEDIKMIMKECYRILRKDGIMSVTIDYQDHWSYFDKSISVYNYLIYEEDEWKKYNPSMHYQNRLRHCDYIHIFEEAGFFIQKINVGDLSENSNGVKFSSTSHEKMEANFQCNSCFTTENSNKNGKESHRPLVFGQSGGYTKEDRDNYRKIKIATCFNKYTEEDLLIKGAHFILYKN